VDETGLGSCSVSDFGISGVDPSGPVTTMLVTYVFKPAIRGSRVRFPAGAGNFSLHHRVQNGCGAHLASYPVGTRGSFPGVKRPGREAGHSSPSSAEVKE
jgi:hypothetical protein